MTFRRKLLVAILLLASAGAVQSQPTMQSAGTAVIVPADGQVTQANDEATINFMLEEQDKDKTAAASRLNAKMKQGIEILRREDPQARLKSHGYYTYPLYPDDASRPTGKLRQPSGWRVGQYLEVKTVNLAALPKTVAAAQRILALNGLQFGLSETATKKLDEQRIDAAYRNLVDRIGAIAKAMGRKAADASIESIDFEGSGAYQPQPEARAVKQSMRAASESLPVEEPSFEPGETSLQLHIVGKVRFK